MTTQLTCLDRFANHNENMIATRLVEDALAAGLVVSVFDGEAFALRRSSDRAAILGALASTDHDSIYFRNAAGERIGHAVLVWGNDCDLISDSSDNDASAALLAGAEALAESLAA